MYVFLPEARLVPSPRSEVQEVAEKTARGAVGIKLLLRW